MDTSFQLAHLLCARICHDLAAPLGAVCMGLEMCASDYPTIDHGAFQTVLSSAQAAAKKLELLRCLTGYAGQKDRPLLYDAISLIQESWRGSRHELRANLKNSEAIRGNEARLYLALILTASDSLAYGGTVIVEDGLHFTAEGREVSLKEGYAEALSLQVSPNALTPKTILPAFAGALARGFGLKIHVAASEGRLHFRPVCIDR